MYISGLRYFGVFVRFLYHRLILGEKTTISELWEKTKYDQDLGKLKLSNHNLGFLFSVFITILIIIFFSFFDN